MIIYTITTCEQSEDKDPIFTIYKTFFINKDMAIRFALKQDKDWRITEYIEAESFTKEDYERGM